MPGFANSFNNRAEYDAAMAEWQRKKASGDPFPGPMPRFEEGLFNQNQMDQLGFPQQIRNVDQWSAMARGGANAPSRATPYSNAIADQSRAAQLALIQQMRGQAAGPSLAAMQGQQALGQMGQQALMQGGRAGMLAAQQGSAGLSGDVARARLAEQMRAQAGMGGVAGNLRGADQTSAANYARAALQQQQQDNAMRQFYASQGASLDEARARALLERYKLSQRIAQQTQKNEAQAADTTLKVVGSILGGML